MYVGLCCSSFNMNWGFSEFLGTGTGAGLTDGWLRAHATIKSSPGEGNFHALLGGQILYLTQ